MVETKDVPKTFGAATRTQSPEVKKVLRELDEIVDEVFLKELEPAIMRARAALGLQK
jgi:hypothetical protein